VRRESSGPGLNVLEPIFDWGLRLAGLLLLLVTGYYIYAIAAHGGQLFGGMASPTQRMSPQEFQRHIGNLELLTKLLTYASVVGIICALGRYYSYAETGFGLAVLGAALMFGMPFLVDHFAQQTLMQGVKAPKNLLAFGDPRLILKTQFSQAGLMLLAVGVVDLIVHAVIFMASAKSRRPKANAEAAKTASQVKKQKDQFFGPCWNLPFCRDTEKQLCPVRHSKKPCWRTGRGCYCDQNIILTLSGGSAYAASRGSSGYLARTATVARPKSYREKRDQCLSCPVYLHHQQQKYQVMAPLSIIGCIAAVAYFLPAMRGGYPETMRGIGRALSGFSFGPSAGGVPEWANNLAAQEPLMWMLLIVAGMLAVAYLLQGVETMLYKLGI
jgi:hypothetical protein